MDAVTTLNEEIQLEELALEAVEKEAALIKRTGRPDIVRLRQLLDFARNYEDRCHRRKEEEHLFRHLERHGNPAIRNQLEEMARELDDEARLVRIISEAVAEYSVSDRDSVEPIRKALHDYHASMKARTRKEHSFLVPLLKRSLDAAEMKTLEAEFEEVDRETVGADGAEHYRKVLRLAIG